MPTNYLHNLARMKVPAMISAGRIVANPAAEAMFGHAPETRKLCEEGLQAALASKTAQELPVNGAAMVFFPVFNDEDRVEAAVGIQATLLDLPSLIHELQRSTPKFSDILHQTPNIILTARPSGQIDYLSRRWYEVTDTHFTMAPEAALRRSIPLDEYSAFRDRWAMGVARGLEFTLRVHLVTTLGTRVFELQARPVIQQQAGIVKWVATLSDVEQAFNATQDLTRLMRRFEILAKAGSILGSARTLNDVADGLIELPAADAKERWFVDLCALSGAPDLRRGLALHEHAAISQALAGGADSVVVRRNEDGAPMRLIASQVRSAESSFGFVGFSRDAVIEPTDAERILLSEVANRVAMAIERILLYLRDQELAQMLQRSMLPLALPYSPGVVLDVAYEPAEREALVGGDWYDAVELPNGLIALAIGDVAGHGFEAAIVMNQVRHTMRAAAFRDPDPAAILASANRVVLAQRQPMVTAHFGVLDPLTLEFTFASAGHLAPLAVAEDGGVRALLAEGIPLGISEELNAQNQWEELAPGGALVLYTDGIIEDLHDPVSGERALCDALARWARGGFLTRAADLQSSLRIGGHHDDAALFVLRFPHADEFKVRLEATPYNARRLRHAARRFVAGSPFDADRAYDAVLAIGEAVNNAIEHPYGGEEGFVMMSLKRETQRLIVDVRDEGAWRDTRSIDRGRGLGIMQTLADSLDIRKSDSGTTVHMEMTYVASAKPALAKASAAR